MNEKQSRLFDTAHRDSRCISGSEVRFLADEVKRLQSAINTICEIGRKGIYSHDKVIEMRSVAVLHERTRK